MKQLWNLEFQIIALIAVGLLARRTGLVGKTGEKNMTDLVLYIVLPCNIFVSFLRGNALENAGDMRAVVLVSIGIQLLSMLYGKFAFPRENEDRRRNLAYGMICSNAGFLGYPVAEGVFGAPGLLLASLYLIPQRIMMWTEGLALYSGVSDAKAAAKKVLTHPCVIACALGLGAMLTGLRVPELLLSPIQSIARCNTPLSMMIIGMILSEIDLRSLADSAILRFSAHRLLLMPLLVYAGCRLLGLSTLVTGVSTLLAAMPAGATTTMLAAKYGRDEQFAVRLVIFTTLLSIPAIFIWSTILAA